MDYDSLTVEDFRNRYRSLPEELRIAIDKTDSDNTVVAIGQKQKLHIDKIEELRETVIMVLYGFLKSSEFVDEVVKRVGISKDIALTISKEVDQEIFEKVRSHLQGLTISQPEEVSDPLPTPPKPPIQPVEASQTPAPTPIIGEQTLHTPEISKVPAVPSPDFSLTEEKLSGSSISSPNTKMSPSEDVDGEVKSEPVQSVNYKGTDPYREPIE